MSYRSVTARREPFVWKRPDDPSARVIETLDGKAIVADEGPQETYEPPGDLFLQFARCPQTEDGITMFANLWGPLGLAARVPIAGRSQRFPLFDTVEDARAAAKVWKPTRNVKRAEPLSAWLSEMRRMRAAVELYERGKRQSPKFWAIVNESIRGCVTPQFSATGKPRLTYRPLNLLGYLWMSLALRSQGTWVERNCRWCKRPLVALRAGARSSRTTCSPSCRVQLAKLRRRVRKRETTMTKAAQRLGVNVKTAREWLDTRPRDAPGGN